MPYDNNAPASQRQHLTEVSGWPGYWATRSGGEVEAETSKVYDGGNKTPFVLSAPAEIGNVTVGRPYKPETHGPIVKRLAKQVGSWRTTVSVWDADPDLGPIGEPTVYPNALLVGLTRPEGDAASSDAAIIELEFAVGEEA